MHEVLLIARREYLERVRSRAFLMMTILFPLFIGLLIGGSVGRKRDRDCLERCSAGARGGCCAAVAIHRRQNA
jgi:hypothetical protein